MIPHDVSFDPSTLHRANRVRAMNRSGRSVLALSLLLAALAREPIAHEAERTKVTLTLGADGRFTLDVANDPSWLLLRLETFAGGSVPPNLTAAERDRRLAELTGVFADRIVLFVDAHEVRASTIEYIPPSVPSAALDSSAPSAAFRLTGTMPRDATRLRWLYGLVADPYPLEVRQPDGSSTVEWIHGTNWSDVIDLSRSFTRPTRAEIALQYLWLGYSHILPKGLDHILFVLGIFLLSPRWKTMLLQVTAFTVAHSITLALSIYGVVSLPSRIVEPLIALSIAYVAIENIVTRELKPWRLALVFLFGLLHGLGFAGVLRELGLPREEFLTALLTFNVGVEGGQLTVIALALALAAPVMTKGWYRQRVVVPASILIAAVGIYWTAARLLSSQ
jgi:HupE / UreJ protein